MFERDLLYKFRKNIEDDLSPEDKELLIKSWITFIGEFCRSVSYHWKSYLSKIGNRDVAEFRLNLTTSDEAFAMWVVFCKYEEAKKDAEEIIRMGMDHWKENRKKKRVGPHDSKECMKDYVGFYNQVVECRKNKELDKFWQDVFFDDLFQDPQKSKQLQNKKNEDEDPNKNGCGEIELPGVDEEFVSDNQTPIHQV